ncbi:hypothetical protein SADUNF_Sadunf15G0026500 [Salix dunnii]|uniref:Uncharacterized protein n=1 Tax=Salix dunnii TaxID=1413687 RepID=A0A835JDL1_9ROSI|nr:hypothetical protein SADUNF_Sadunf15G0026500 [Salix dunnii]
MSSLGPGFIPLVDTFSSSTSHVSFQVCFNKHQEGKKRSLVSEKSTSEYRIAALPETDQIKLGYLGFQRGIKLRTWDYYLEMKAVKAST